jgi:hypothetical protein
MTPPERRRTTKRRAACGGFFVKGGRDARAQWHSFKKQVHSFKGTMDSFKEPPKRSLDSGWLSSFWLLCSCYSFSLEHATWFLAAWIFSGMSDRAYLSDDDL